MVEAKAFPWAETHPFIAFAYDTRTLPLPTWTLLGECSSKIEHVSGTPLSRETAEELRQVFLAKGVHATTAIEGNTLSQEQVRKRLQGELALPPSQEYLGREIDNVVKAYNYLVEQLGKGVPFKIGPQDLKNLNKMVLQDLESGEGVVPGQYRLHAVAVSDYLPPPARFVPEMVSEGCRWLNHDAWEQVVGSRFVIPLLRAILAHLYIAWIHPFGDGNGRTARMVEFDLLIRAGVPIVSAHLMSDHYNRTRAAYYRALSTARETPSHFVQYAVEGLLDLLREQLALIRKQHDEVTWINYVHENFQQKDHSEQSRRRKAIALALMGIRAPVRLEKIPELSPKLAAMYSSRTSRTLRRDVRALRSQHLVLVTKDGVTANLGLIRAFLPLVGEANQGDSDGGAEKPGT